MRKPKILQLLISYKEGRQPKRLGGSTMEVKQIKTSALTMWITKLNAGKIARLSLTVARILIVAIALASCSASRIEPSNKKRVIVELIDWELVGKNRIRLELQGPSGATFCFFTPPPRYTLRRGLKYAFVYDSTRHKPGVFLPGSLTLKR